jgi:hypothetical protein
VATEAIVGGATIAGMLLLLLPLPSAVNVADGDSFVVDEALNVDADEWMLLGVDETVGGGFAIVIGVVEVDVADGVKAVVLVTLSEDDVRNEPDSPRL